MNVANVRADLETRFSRVIDDRGRYMTNPDTKRIVELAEELGKVGGFYKVFHMLHARSLDTLEDVENFYSFVGNFVDDAYFMLTEDLEYRKSVEPVRARMGLVFKPRFCIVWCTDSDPYLSQSKLVKFLEKQLKKEKKAHKRREEWDKEL